MNGVTADSYKGKAKDKGKGAGKLTTRTLVLDLQAASFVLFSRTGYNIGWRRDEENLGRNVCRLPDDFLQRLVFQAVRD